VNGDKPKTLQEVGGDPDMVIKTTSEWMRAQGEAEKVVLQMIELEGKMLPDLFKVLDFFDKYGADPTFSPLMMLDYVKLDQLFVRRNEQASTDALTKILTEAGFYVSPNAHSVLSKQKTLKEYLYAAATMGLGLVESKRDVRKEFASIMKGLQNLYVATWKYGIPGLRERAPSNRPVYALQSPEDYLRYLLGYYTQTSTLSTKDLLLRSESFALDRFDVELCLATFKRITPDMFDAGVNFYLVAHEADGRDQTVAEQAKSAFQRYVKRGREWTALYKKLKDVHEKNKLFRWWSTLVESFTPPTVSPMLEEFEFALTPYYKRWIFTEEKRLYWTKDRVVMPTDDFRPLAVGGWSSPFCDGSQAYISASGELKEQSGLDPFPPNCIKLIGETYASAYHRFAGIDKRLPPVQKLVLFLLSPFSSHPPAPPAPLPPPAEPEPVAPEPEPVAPVVHSSVEVHIQVPELEPVPVPTIPVVQVQVAPTPTPGAVTGAIPKKRKRKQ
jgi:hypothetical protein